MLKIMQNVLYALLVLGCCCAMYEARPQSIVGDDKQDLEALEPEVEEIRSGGGGGGYYDLPTSAYYPNIPFDRLQMLFAQYRPTAYLRAPTLNSFNELYRLPETKRQVRYRQCYFNPISCFKK